MSLALLQRIDLDLLQALMNAEYQVNGLTPAFKLMQRVYSERVK